MRGGANGQDAEGWAHLISSRRSTHTTSSCSVSQSSAASAGAPPLISTTTLPGEGIRTSAGAPALAVMRGPQAATTDDTLGPDTTWASMMTVLFVASVARRSLCDFLTDFGTWKIPVTPAMLLAVATPSWSREVRNVS